MFNKLKRIKEKSLHSRIKSIVEKNGYSIIEYVWDHKMFGDIFLKITNGINEHTFLTDRGDIIFDSKYIDSHYEHLAGFDDTPIYFIIALEDYFNKYQR